MSIGIIQELRCALIGAFLLLLPIASAHSQQVELAVASAEVTQNMVGRTAITVTLDSESSRAFASFTEASLGRMVEICLADKVLSRTRIQTSITKGRFMFLSGDDTGELIEKLSKNAKLQIRTVDESRTK
jgi:preprotein translocase subunit SecD